GVGKQKAKRSLSKEHISWVSCYPQWQNTPCSSSVKESIPLFSRCRVIRIGSKCREVLVMRSAETVLAVIHERGKQGLALEDIYRQLYNPDLYLRAYARLYSNEGAMTKGTTSETVDDMSMKKIEALIDDLRQERYRWRPVRRTDIPKKKGKLRPLGLPSWTE